MLFLIVVSTIISYHLMAGITAGICERLWKGTTWDIENHMNGQGEAENYACMVWAAIFWPLTWIWWLVKWPCIGCYKLTSGQYKTKKEKQVATFTTILKQKPIINTLEEAEQLKYLIDRFEERKKGRL